MPSSVVPEPNPEGLGQVDVMGAPGYAARLRAYSDHLRRVTGNAPLRLWELPEFQDVQSQDAETARSGPVPSR